MNKKRWNYWSKYQFAQRKHPTQYALLKLIQSIIVAVLIDRSKTFDKINDDHASKKLHAYGVRGKSLNLERDCLYNRFHRPKVNFSHSISEELLTCVPQGSVFSTLLFNIYLNYMFHMIKHTKICNFADGTTPYSSFHNVKAAMINVEHDWAILF